MNLNLIINNPLIFFQVLYLIINQLIFLHFYLLNTLDKLFHQSKLTHKFHKDLYNLLQKELLQLKIFNYYKITHKDKFLKTINQHLNHNQY